MKNKNMKDVNAKDVNAKDIDMIVKNMKSTTIITSIICLIPVILGIIFYPKMPNTIVTHWSIDGTPNGWTPKLVGAIVFPGILLLVNLCFPFLIKIDPKHNNMNTKVKCLLHWIIPLVSVFCSGITLASALGKKVNIPLLGPLFMGFLFIAIGNYLPKISQSYTVGIKIPWTLNSTENWNKTHRMAGFLWVIGGLAMMLTATIGVGVPAVAVIVTIMIVVPMIYSYLMFRKGI